MTRRWLSIACLILVTCSTAALLRASSSCGPGSFRDSSLASTSATGSGTDELVRFDFETGGLQDWAVYDGKFGKIVADREMFRNRENRGKKWNKQGKFHLSTNELADGGFDDKMTGVIESPVFVLAGPEVSFLVGGGSHDDTYVALCTDDGLEAFKGSGASSEIMRRVTWDARNLVGRKVFVKVVDANAGPWGHVTFDDFQAAGRIDPQATAERRANRDRLEKERQARQEAADKARAEKLAAERAERMKDMTDPQRLFERGASRVYQGEYLGAVSMPVGGIGAGNIQINGRAERTIWQIFNNYYPAPLPNSFFAARIKAADGEPILRAMQTAGVGPFAPMKELTFRGEYPFGRFDFADPFLPVRFSLEAYSPLIPLDLKNSAIPCAIFTLTAENTSQAPVEVSFLAAQQNAVGFGGETLDSGPKPVAGRKYPGYGGNVNSVVRQDGATILHLSSKASSKGENYGDLALAAVGGEVTASASWNTPESLAADLTDDGRLSGPQATEPTPAGQTVDGALASAARIEPGRKHTVTFVLTWHFPNGTFGGNRQGKQGKSGWYHEGNMYANWWKDAMDAARYVVAALPELDRKTREYHDTFYQTNLPWWLLDRITSQTAVLRSPTCFWAKDGYFGGWEGCCRHKGCCPGNCAHVWQYAQAHARLFPEIGRRMREESFSYEEADGGIPFRHPSGRKAADGQCGEILGAYREHLCSPDGKWLKKNWPKIRQAMEYVIATWDKDEDGVLAGAQHNTLDTELGGSSSWLGSLYMAALSASEKMAALQGDGAAAARFGKILASGTAKQNASLWNGEYYVQIPDSKPQRDYVNGCAIDQMLGQWWAHQLDLGWLYPPDRVRTAMQSLLKYNFRPDFHGVVQKPRKFVADEDAGLQMICWPKGDRPANHTLYADEVMSGFEYSAAGMMVQAGLLREAFTVVRAAAGRYDGRLRVGLAGDLVVGRQAWGYSGNPFGDDECGKFYARAMSVYSMLLACQGFVYDGPAGVIGFLPVWKPEDHCSFFAAAEGWGLFSQKRDGGRQVERIELRYGRLAVSSLVFAPAGAVANVSVTAGGKSVEAKHHLEGGRLTIRLSRPVTIQAGEEMTVIIE